MVQNTQEVKQKAHWHIAAASCERDSTRQWSHNNYLTKKSHSHPFLSFFPLEIVALCVKRLRFRFFPSLDEAASSPSSPSLSSSSLASAFSSEPSSSSLVTLSSEASSATKFVKVTIFQRKIFETKFCTVEGKHWIQESNCTILAVNIILLLHAGELFVKPYACSVSRTSVVHCNLRRFRVMHRFAPPIR